MRRKQCTFSRPLLISVLVLSVFLFLLPCPLGAATLDGPTVNCTTASTTVLAAPSTERKWLFLQNKSDTDMNVTVDGDTATTAVGFLLKANVGAKWWDVPGTIPQGDIKCIHGGAGNKSLYIEEKH